MAKVQSSLRDWPGCVSFPSAEALGYWQELLRSLRVGISPGPESLERGCGATLPLLLSFRYSMQAEEPNVNRSEAFYSGALDRIRISMIAVGLIFSAAALVQYGWRVGLGFALGCVVSYLNFYWLKRVVSAMADRITKSGKNESGKGIVARFLLRYVLMGLAAYAILSVSPASLYGLLAGLFLPVAAIACEAGYEVYVAVARGL